MKKLFTLLFCSFFFLNFASSQIVLETTEVLLEVEDFDLSDLYAEEIIENSITNESMEDIDIRWTFIEGTCPEEWDWIKQDENITYAHPVTSNVDPSVGLNTPVTLEAGETGSYLLLFVYPRQVAGCCQVAYELSDANDPTATPIATAVYDVYINAPDCPLVSNTFEEENNKVKIFPNPTTGFVSIQSEYAVKNVQLYSIQGQDFGSINVPGNNELDLSNFPAGIYFLKIMMENEKIIWSKINRI